MSSPPLSAPAPRLGRRLFVLALLLLFAGLSVKYSLKVLQDRSAFRRWQPQLLDLDKGVDISQAYNYPNPPVMAVLLEPLAKLPPLAGALTWFYLKVGMALLALHWVFGLVEEPGRPFPPWARALGVLLSLKPVVDDLNHGNVNLLILFLVVAALTLYSRRRDFLAGVVLALAVACKVTPALFLPYLVWKRAWRALAGCAVGLGWPAGTKAWSAPSWSRGR
jgi:alpha-1,2-mannosyltransferase